MTQVDSELGWRNRPGKYEYYTDSKHRNLIQVSIDESGRRSIAEPGKAAEVWVFGCSYTFGWGVSDGEDFSSVADSIIRDRGVWNFGVVGYGAVQGFQLYRKILAETDPKRRPKVIVYGMHEFHEMRNVASAPWLRALEAGGHRNSWVTQPPRIEYAEARTIRLVPPATVFSLPFSRRLVSASIAQSALLNYIAAGREGRQREISSAFIDQWRSEVESQGMSFVVLYLGTSAKRSGYDQIFREREFRVLDGSNGYIKGGGETVPGDDGHPGRAIHRSWGEDLAEFVSQ